jgi:hypothetical protein
MFNDINKSGGYEFMVKENFKTLDQLLRGRDSFDSDVIIEIMEEQIKLLYQKIISGNIRNPKNEEIRIKQIRSLSQLCKTYQDMKETEKLEKLSEEIRFLKEAMEKRKKEE